VSDTDAGASACWQDRRMITARLSIGALVPVLALAGLPSAAGALGLNPAFPRTIAILHSTAQIHPTRFEVSTRSVGRKIRVTVHVVATGIGGARKFVVAVGPCTGGTPTSPLCKPTATARVTASTTRIAVTRRFLVARPAAARDALRVTLTPAGDAVPYQPTHVGGGGGMGEILLNDGDWRFKQGTLWGIAMSEPSGVTINQVKFNSRTYAWTGTSRSDLAVSTKIGYESETPRWNFANTMHAGKPYNFHHTPASPIQDTRTSPRAFSIGADAGAQPLFTVRVPLPVWGGM
jgi:hypothetical protein